MSFPIFSATNNVAVSILVLASHNTLCRPLGWIPSSGTIGPKAIFVVFLIYAMLTYFILPESYLKIILSNVGWVIKKKHERKYVILLGFCVWRGSNGREKAVIQWIFFLSFIFVLIEWHIPPVRKMSSPFIQLFRSKIWTSLFPLSHCPFSASSPLGILSNLATSHHPFGVPTIAQATITEPLKWPFWSFVFASWSFSFYFWHRDYSCVFKMSFSYSKPSIRFPSWMERSLRAFSGPPKP